MATITKERLEKLIRAIECESHDEEEIKALVSSDEIFYRARIALESLIAKHAPASDARTDMHDIAGMKLALYELETARQRFAQHFMKKIEQQGVSE